MAEPEEPVDTSGQMFDADYYRHDCGVPYERNEHWLGFFGSIAEQIVLELAPSRVLDVGCAKGFLVEALRERGVEAWGIDVSEYAIGEVHESVRKFCAVGSVTDELPPAFPTDYDLVTCIEVIEHLPADAAPAAIEQLTRWGRRVLFSSSPEDYAEPTHFNVQPLEEWSALFARARYLRHFDTDASFLTPWAVVYERDAMAVPGVVRRYERRMARYRRENLDLRAAVGRLQKRMAELDRASEHAVDAQRSAEEGLTAARLDMAREADRAAESAASRDAAVREVTALTEEVTRLRDLATEQQSQAAELHRHYQAAIRARDAAQSALAALAQKDEAQAAQAAAIAQAVDDLRAQSQHVTTGHAEHQELLAARAEVQAVHASTTWRVGRLVVAPADRLRRLVRGPRSAPTS